METEEPYLLTTTIKYMTIGTPYVVLPFLWNIDAGEYFRVNILNRRTKKSCTLVKRTFRRGVSVGMYLPTPLMREISDLNMSERCTDLVNIEFRHLTPEEAEACGALSEES